MEIKYTDVICKDRKIRTISFEVTKFSTQYGCAHDCIFGDLCEDVIKSPETNKESLMSWCCEQDNELFPHYMDNVFLYPRHLFEEYPELFLKENRPIWKILKQK